MAYDGTIPALGNLISNDIPAMQENFSLLESAQVVDEGSTADGNYIRYENGWQICVYKYPDSIDINTTRGSGYENGTTLVWNLPVNFLSGDFYSGGEVSSTTVRWCSTQTSTSGELQFRLLSFDTTTGEEVTLLAIGRWK